MSESAPSRDAADSSRGLVVQITVAAGPHAGTTVHWRVTGDYTIGRSGQSQLPLPHDLTVSLEHCRVELKEHGCLIQDLDSRQGILVNGSPASRMLLNSGDRIRIGMSELVVTLNGPGEPEPTLVPRRPWTPGAATVIGDVSGEDPVPGVLDIPDYRIVRTLGHGGMGVVYEAIHEPTRNRVAIKTIIPAPGTAQRSILLFQREMEVLGQLRHPRIVRYLDSGEHAGQIYLVMEYVPVVELEPLLQTLPRERQVRIVCGVGCEVLDALEFAHQRKLVHRDVKPRNILASREGRRLRVKLADFGLAKNYEFAGLSQLTADHELRGTPTFMPWEQLQNSRYAKPAADIYSTAATMVYFLTGASPGHTAPGSSSVDIADIPPELASILEQALAADPQLRFKTAAQMRRALLPFAGGKPAGG